MEVDHDEMADRPLHPSELLNYIELLEAFLNDAVTPADFQDVFIERYLKGPIRWNRSEYVLLDHFFGFVEDYVDDSGLRAETGGEDLASLRTAAAQTVIGLQGLIQGPELPEPPDSP